jgi:hypothetical protein
MHPQKCVGIAMGEEHCAVVTDKGALWTFGRTGKNGVLGRPEGDNTPVVVKLVGSEVSA